jgi:hypothetical protein
VSDDPRIVTVVEQLPVTLRMDEARKQLGNVCEMTVRRWVEIGKLKRADLPGVFLISTASVLAAANPTDNPADNSED